MFNVPPAKQLINLDDHDHTGSCPSIREIHEEYFQGIEEHLCKLLQALDQTSDSNCINSILSLDEWLWKFWHHRVLCLEDKLNMQDSLRVAFGIDTANHGSPNSIISNVGLYADTVVITDPVLVFLRIAGGFNPEDSSQIRFATSIVLQSMRTILECRSAFVTDLEYPLAVLYPEVLHETPINFSFVCSMVEQDALRVFSALLGKSFNSYSHLERQLKRIKSELDLDKRVTNKSLWCKVLDPAAIVPSDTIRFLNTQINNAATYEMRAAYKWDSLTTGQKARFHFTARYTQINELLYKAWQTGSHPVFSSNPNWNFWLAKKILSEETVGKNSSTETMIAAFLNTTKSSKMKLLTEFSIKDLITLRERGALNDLRRSLFREVNDLPTSLDSVDLESRLSKSVEDLLRNHAESLEKMALRDAQFFGFKIVPFLANASVAVAGLSMEDPSIKALGAAFGISGFGSIKDVVNDWRKKEEEKRLLLSSATAFLFQKSKEA